jgi:hypothetical protein
MHKSELSAPVLSTLNLSSCPGIPPLFLLSYSSLHVYNPCTFLSPTLLSSLTTHTVNYSHPCGPRSDKTAFWRPDPSHLSFVSYCFPLFLRGSQWDLMSCLAVSWISASELLLAACFMLICCISYSSTLKMEAI